MRTVFRCTHNLDFANFGGWSGSGAEDTVWRPALLHRRHAYRNNLTDFMEGLAVTVSRDPNPLRVIQALPHDE